MANATITRLPDYYRPWAWSLKVTSIDQDVFHELIESLKLNINYRKRKWDPTGKRWLFHADMIDDVAFVLDSFGVAYTIDDQQSQRTNGRHRQTSERPSTALLTRQQAAAELYLLPDAPPDVITAVFRVLAKQYHPDMGGDTEQMQRLNAAMEALR